MQNIENQIREYTRSIWKSILGLQVHPTEEDFTPPGKKEPMIAGCVQIMGEWKGTVALSCPIPLARQAAAIMFQLQEDTAGPEEIQDAFGELANITGGNIKALLPEPSYLSLPAVAVTEHGLRIPGSALMTKANFQCDGFHFQVSLLKKLEEEEKKK